MMRLVDTHCHVNFGAFRDDWQAVVDRAQAAGVAMLNVGTNLATSRRSVEIAEQVGEGMAAAIGLHPIHLAREITESAQFDGKAYAFKTKAERFDKRDYFALAESAKVVAVGESGLDYYQLEDFKAAEMTAEEYIALQKETLHEILMFAREINRPHIFHCREAYDDFVEIIEEFSDNSDGASGPGYQVRGVVHCFTGTVAQAERILALGLSIGFTGIASFPNAEALREVVKSVPLDRLLLETDAPYLAPQPVRGQRNEPAHVFHVAEAIAAVKGVAVEEIARQTTENASRLFGFPTAAASAKVA